MVNKSGDQSENIFVINGAGEDSGCGGECQ
jgi:hypothetical protein